MTSLPVRSLRKGLGLTGTICWVAMLISGRTQAGSGKVELPCARAHRRHVEVSPLGVRTLLRS